MAGEHGHVHHDQAGSRQNSGGKMPHHVTSAHGHGDHGAQQHSGRHEEHAPSLGRRKSSAVVDLDGQFNDMASIFTQSHHRTHSFIHESPSKERRHSKGQLPDFPEDMPMLEQGHAQPTASCSPGKRPHVNREANGAGHHSGGHERHAPAMDRRKSSMVVDLDGQFNNMAHIFQAHKQHSHEGGDMDAQGQPFAAPPKLRLRATSNVYDGQQLLPSNESASSPFCVGALRRASSNVYDGGQESPSLPPYFAPRGLPDDFESRKDSLGVPIGPRAGVDHLATSTPLRYIVVNEMGEALAEHVIPTGVQSFAERSASLASDMPSGGRGSICADSFTSAPPPLLTEPKKRRTFKWTSAAHPEIAGAVQHRHRSLAHMFHVDGFHKRGKHEVGRLRAAAHHCWPMLFPLLVGAAVAAGFLIPQIYAQIHPWRDAAKEEEDPDLPKRYRGFNEANVPPLRRWSHGENTYGAAPFNHFYDLGSEAYNPPTAPAGESTTNCTAVFRGWLEDHLSQLQGKTDPTFVRLILDMLELTNISQVRNLQRMNALLTTPQDFLPMLRQVSDCAETNAPLQAYACEALNDPQLMTRLQAPAGYDSSFVREELEWALHFGVVLETLTAAAVEDPEFRTAVHWQMTLIAGRIYDRIKVHVAVTPTHRQYFEQLEVIFKKQKWHSIESATRELELMKLQAGDTQVAVGIQLNLAMNIMEAAHLELVDGVPANVELALALAVGAQGALPSIKNMKQLWWPLGKSWADAYVAWNLEYVSHFETVHHPTKLLIPSLLCHDENAGHFFDARTFSLKLFQVYYTNRRDLFYIRHGTGSRGNGVWNATLQERRTMSEIFLKHSKLPKPADTTFGFGSLERLFDSLDPAQGFLEFVTSAFNHEYFLYYSTFCVWITVVAAGFGSEVVLGEHIIKHSSDHDDHHWLSVTWHAAQLAFSLFLTVALFAHSAIGLPFLVVGLWKGGFPETVCCFLGGYIHGGTVQGVCLFMDGLGFVLHHSTTAFVIVALTTEFFPASRQIIGCCVIPVMQHWFVLLRYHSKSAYIVIELLLEVYFQIEVISYMPYFTTHWGPDFDRFGRACAMTMLLSHWIWFASSCIRMAEPYLLMFWDTPPGKILFRFFYGIERVVDTTLELIENSRTGNENEGHAPLQRKNTLQSWQDALFKVSGGSEMSRNTSRRGSLPSSKMQEAVEQAMKAAHLPDEADEEIAQKEAQGNEPVAASEQSNKGDSSNSAMVDTAMPKKMF